MRFLDYLIMPLADTSMDSRLRNCNVVWKVVFGCYVFAQYFVGNIYYDRRSKRRVELDRRDSEIGLRWIRIFNRLYTKEQVEAANRANLKGPLSGC